MASNLKTYDDFLKEQEKLYKAQMDKDIADLKNQAEENKSLIEEKYAADIANEEGQYGELARRTDLQRVLNERHLERKAAELGLTDSGLNRTQLTANQLYYGNQQSNIQLEKQKAIDTLARAMRAEKSNIDAQTESNIRQTESGYRSLMGDQASANYKNYLSANNLKIDESGKVIQASNPVAEGADFSSVYKTLKDSASSQPKKANLIKTFVSENYGNYTMTQLEQLFDVAGIEDEKEFWFANAFYSGKTIDENGKIVDSETAHAGDNWFPSTEYLEKVISNPYIEDSDKKRLEENYKKSGMQKYRIYLNDSTRDWDGGVSERDVVTIYYPFDEKSNRVAVLKKVKLKDLPEIAALDITKLTEGKDDKTWIDGYVELDLSEI